MIQKRFRLTAELKNAYFSETAQKKWLKLVEAKISANQKQKTLETQFIYSGFCYFWDFRNILYHITGGVCQLESYEGF